MVHAMIHWLYEVNMNLSLFAIPYSYYLWNKITRGKAMISLEKLFYDVNSDHQELQPSKSFGRPTYFLGMRIYNGRDIHQWSIRISMGKFLGCSDDHSLSLCIICNLTVRTMASATLTAKGIWVSTLILCIDLFTLVL